MKHMDEIIKIEEQKIASKVHELRTMKSGIWQWFAPDGKAGLRLLFKGFVNNDKDLVAEEADDDGNLGELFKVTDKPPRTKDAAKVAFIKFVRYYVKNSEGRPWSKEAESILR